MASGHGKNQRVIIDSTDASSIGKMARLRQERDTAEASTFEDHDKVFAAGLRGGSFSLEAVFKSEKDATVAVLADMIGSTTATHALSYGPQGFAVGAAVYDFTTNETDAQVGGDLRSVVYVNLTFQVTGAVSKAVSLGDPFA